MATGGMLFPSYYFSLNQGAVSLCDFLSDHRESSNLGLAPAPLTTPRTLSFVSWQQAYTSPHLKDNSYDRVEVSPLVRQY